MDGLMRFGFSRKHMSLSGSRTLAVVSCAVALLASHPMAAQVLAEPQVAAVRPLDAAPQTSPVIRAQVQSPQAFITEKPTRAAVRSSAIRRHDPDALAALDLLGRMLVRHIVDDLTDSYGHALVPMAAAGVAAEFPLLSPRLLPPTDTAQPLGLPDVARDFAIAHLLSAPPAA